MDGNEGATGRGSGRATGPGIDRVPGKARRRTRTPGRAHRRPDADEATG